MSREVQMGGSAVGRGPGASGLQVAVPTRQLADAPLALRVRGIPIGAEVRVELHARWWTGEQLAAMARYVSVDGAVDVSRDAPVTGYAGVDTDGLLAMLAPPRLQEQAALERRGGSVATSSAGSALDDDVFEVCAAIDEPGGARVCSVTRRAVRSSTLAVVPLSVDGEVATLYHDPGKTPYGPMVLAVPLLDTVPASRAAALLAAHGHVVLLLRPQAAGTPPAMASDPLVRAAEQAVADRGPRRAHPTVVLGLDVVADRRSPEATRAWGELIGRLRRLRVATHPPR